MPDDGVNQKRKINRAVALQYQDADEIPHVIASGLGEAAQKILNAAKEAGVPVTEDSDLTDLLSALPAGASITPKMYKLVAHVIAFLYFTDDKWRQTHGFLRGLMEVEDAPEQGDR